MRIETLAVHAGYSPDPTTKAVAVPIYQTVAYAFDSAQHCIKRLAHDTQVLLLPSSDFQAHRNQGFQRLPLIDGNPEIIDANRCQLMAAHVRVPDLR